MDEYKGLTLAPFSERAAKRLTSVFSYLCGQVGHCGDTFHHLNWPAGYLGKHTGGVRAKGRGQTHRQLLEGGIASHQEALEVRFVPPVTEDAAFLLSGEAGMCDQSQEDVEISSH